MVLPWADLELCLPGRCGRVRCEPEWRLSAAWSQQLPDMDLWFVWAGSGVMRLQGGRQVALRPGTLLWMRPGGLYLGEQDSADRLGVSFVHFDLLDRRSGRRPATLPPEVHHVVDVPYVDAVMRRVVELIHGDGHHPAEAEQPRDDEPAFAPREVAGVLLRGLLMDLDAGAAHPPRHEPAGTAAHHRHLVMRIAARIRESPGDVPAVAEMAREVGYSPDHFARIFREVLNLSPRDYIVQQRVHRAQQLLLESALSVTQIADALGYESVYFFSRQFKEKTGLSPSTYRRQLTT